MPKFLDEPVWYNDEQNIVKPWEKEDLFFRIFGRTTQKRTKGVTGDDLEPVASYSLGNETHSYEITACVARPEDQDEDIWEATQKTPGVWDFSFDGHHQIQVSNNEQNNILVVDCTDFFSPTGYFQTYSVLPYITISYNEYIGHNNNLEIYTRNNTLANLLFTIEKGYIEIEDTN